MMTTVPLGTFIIREVSYLEIREKSEITIIFEKTKEIHEKLSKSEQNLRKI